MLVYIKLLEKFKDLDVTRVYGVTKCSDFYRLETLKGTDDTIYLYCIPFDNCEVI